MREGSDALRMLVRHQWVREHGTPRITTLAGAPGVGRELWEEWLALCQKAGRQRRGFEQPVRGADAWLDAIVPRAAALAEAAPGEPVAIFVEDALVGDWLRGRSDRFGALIEEGLVVLGGRRRVRGRDAGATAGVTTAGVTTAGVTTAARRPTRAGRGAAASPSPRAGAARLAKARSLAELTLFEALEATAATAGRFGLNESVSFHFGSRAAEVDLLSREDEIAIEVDGFHHFTDAGRYRKDRHKDLLLQAHGYSVLRFLADDVLADPRQAVRMVVELLAHRGRRGRATLRRP